MNIYKKVLLLHSEKQSSNVEQYQQDQFIPVYWWSHGAIALDWFRYARHIKLKKQYKQRLEELRKRDPFVYKNH